MTCWIFQEEWKIRNIQSQNKFYKPFQNSLSFYLIPTLNTNIVRTARNKITNWHCHSYAGSNEPEPQLGVRIIGEVENEVTGLLPGSGGMGGFGGSCGMER